MISSELAWVEGFYDTTECGRLLCYFLKGHYWPDNYYRYAVALCVKPTANLACRDETERSDPPCIALVSLAAERVFSFKHKQTVEIDALILLAGSVLIV